MTVPGEASAMVVGEGPLAGAAATALAAAGFGRIGLVAADGSEAAAAKLGLLVPGTVVEPYPVALEVDNAEAIVAGADVVLACGSPPEQELVNDACCRAVVPLVVGELREWAGLVLSVRPGHSACLRCALRGDDEPSSASGDEGGAGAALAGIVGSVQALEALKLATAAGEPLLDRVLELDGRDMSSEIRAVAAQEGCPACARVPAAPHS